MPHSTRSSSASAPCRPPVDASGCRLERRASPLLVAVLLALALAAAFAVLVSEMPRIAAWPLALSALAHGGWLAWREVRAVRGELVIAGAGGRASGDGRGVEDLSVRWRGPIAFVEWRDGDGRRRRHVFFPDTLDRKSACRERVCQYV